MTRSETVQGIINEMCDYAIQEQIAVCRKSRKRYYVFGFNGVKYLVARKDAIAFYEYRLMCRRIDV